MTKFNNKKKNKFFFSSVLVILAVQWLLIFPGATEASVEDREDVPVKIRQALHIMKQQQQQQQTRYLDDGVNWRPLFQSSSSTSIQNHQQQHEQQQQDQQQQRRQPEQQQQQQQQIRRSEQQNSTETTSATTGRSLNNNEVRRALLQPFFPPHSKLASVQRFHATTPTEDAILENDEDGDDPMVHVLIKFKSPEGKTRTEQQYALAYREGPGLQKHQALSAMMRTSALIELDQDPDVDYWEVDSIIRPITSVSLSSSSSVLQQDQQQLRQKNQQQQQQQHRKQQSAVVGSSGEISLYGMKLIQADYTSVPTSDTTGTTTTTTLPTRFPLNMTGACSDPDSFKIGIIDSGAYVLHPDLPCVFDDTSDLGSDGNAQTSNCIGETFGLLQDETWWDVTDVHGTHVFGTIGALGGSSSAKGFAGVHGVIQDRNVCYLHARIFGRLFQAEISSLMEALDWLTSYNVHVINMSLGGGIYSKMMDEVFAGLENDGILVVAAAGNDGSSGVSRSGYPAAYDSVLSVAAIDQTLEHADYSNYNEDVAVSAPGTGILSTAPPLLGGVAVLLGKTESALGNFLSGSVLPDTTATSATDTATTAGQASISGFLIECPDFGASDCPSAPNGNKHICLIERGGGVLFEDKGMGCQKSGGVAAVIYNNEPGLLSSGTLATPTSVTIPVLGISQEDGQLLLSSNTVGTRVRLRSQDGYTVLDGTSMACPHVTGAAGLIWQHCRDCTNFAVSHCLQKTARDLGSEGRDEFFGFGLIQVPAAYNCLINDLQCCQAPPPMVQPQSIAVDNGDTTTTTVLDDGTSTSAAGNGFGESGTSLGQQSGQADTPTPSPIAQPSGMEQEVQLGGAADTPVDGTGYGTSNNNNVNGILLSTSAATPESSAPSFRTTRKIFVVNTFVWTVMMVATTTCVSYLV